MKLIFLVFIYFLSILILAFVPYVKYPYLVCGAFLLGSLVLYLIVFKFDYIKKKITGFKVILILTLLVRVPFIGYSPGTDIYRYAWEGNQASKGINPYVHAPLWFTEGDIQGLSKNNRRKLIELLNSAYEIKNNNTENYTNKQLLTALNLLIQEKVLVKNLTSSAVTLKETSLIDKTKNKNISVDEIQKNRENLTSYLNFLQDDIQKNVNHKELTAIYPPFSMLIFSLLMSIAYSVVIFKIFFLFCEIVGIFFVVLLLKKLKKPLHWSLLYTMSPLVLVYGFGECHIDVLQSALVISSIYIILFSKARYWLALGFLLLGCAVLTKYLAIIALPFLVKKNNVMFLFYFFLPFLSYLIFIDQTMFSSLFLFSGNMHFNDAIPRILRVYLQQDGLWYKFFMIFIFSIIYAIMLLFFQDEPIKGILLSWVWLVLCMPVLHPWYLITILLLMCLYPQRNVLYLTLIMCFYFFVMSHYEIYQEWLEFWWLPIITYGGFYYVAMSERNQLVPQVTKDNRNIKSLDIIIPVLNEEQKIKNSLDCLFNEINVLKGGSIEINVFIVDGGSKDKTIEIASKYPVNISHCNKKGRGNQLANGFELGKGELVLFLHADSSVKISAINKLIEIFKINPNLEWGILGHKYDNQSFKLKLIEFLNNQRFNYLGIAFGDQGMFVRRSLLNQVGLPKIPLMEDIELSLRLHCCNYRLNLNGYLIGSARRWENRKFTNSFFQVVFLCFNYAFWRKMGFDVKKLSEKMYRAYYK